MLTDYKIWYIKHAGDNGTGQILECGVRFYEGEITTVNEKNLDGEIVPVTKYRRSLRLDPKKDLAHLAKQQKDGKFGLNVKEELNGNQAVVYTPNDFGVIDSIDALRTFLNGEISKDKSRQVVDAQKHV